VCVYSIFTGGDRLFVMKWSREGDSRSVIDDRWKKIETGRVLLKGLVTCNAC